MLDDDDPAVRQVTKRVIVDWLRDLTRPKPELDDSWLTKLEELPSELPRLYGGGLDRGRMIVGHLSYRSWWTVGWEGIDLLARSDDPAIRAAVAGFAGEHREEGESSRWQTTLAEKTLLWLLADVNEAVRKAALGNEGPTAILAASNDQSPVDALVHYARSRSAALRAATAANPMTPGPVLANLARDSNDAVRVAVAGNPSTPKNALAILTKDSEDKVVMELLSNPNTPSDFLMTQANRDSDWGDRLRHERLANNPSAEADVLRKVAFSKWDHVREAVAAHPTTAADTIEILSFDESPRVRAAVGRRNT